MPDYLEFVDLLYAGQIHNFAYTIVFFCVIIFLESLFPIDRGQSTRGKARNAMYGLLFIVFGTATLSGILFVVFQILPQTMNTHESLPQALTTVLLYAIFFDHSFYWYHRAEHTFPHLWVIHELHHADDEMNVFTSVRTYFLEKPLQYLIIILPLLISAQFVPGLSFLQLGTISAPVLSLFLMFGLYISHANIRLSLGKFSGIFVLPQVHRIHHSREQQHVDKNFAQFFPFIDIIYGTYYAPQKDEYPATGTQNLRSDAVLYDVLVRPFRVWLSALRQKFPR